MSDSFDTVRIVHIRFVSLVLRCSTRLMPETLHALVGNGSIRPSRIYRPIISIIGRERGTPPARRVVLPPAKFRNPFLLLKNLDIAILLFVNGIFIAVYFAVTASISTVFHEAYPFLDETKLGLCFLTVGAGMITGSTTTGILMDADFQRFKKRILNDSDKNSRQLAEDEHFPLELVRLTCLEVLYSC